MNLDQYLDGMTTYAKDRDYLLKGPGKPRVRNILHRCLKGFPNLTQIEVHTEKDSIGAAEAKRVFGKLLGDEFTKSSTSALMHLMTALAGVDIPLSALRFGARSARSSQRNNLRRSRGLERCFGYLRPPSLTFSPGHRTTNPDALRYAVQQSDCTRQMFRDLKAVEIENLSFAEDEEDSVERFVAGPKPILSAAHNLDTLVILELHGNWGPIETVDLSKALPLTQPLRKLRILNCKGCSLRGGYLLDFIRSSSASLEYVRLFEFELVAGDWRTTLDHLRQGSFPSITSFEIENISKPYGGDVAPYLKKLTNVYLLES